MLRWFDLASGVIEDQCSAQSVVHFGGTVDLREVSAIKRVKPDSATDYRFELVLADRRLALDPGSSFMFSRWEDGLLNAMTPVPPSARAPRCPAARRRVDGCEVEMKSL